MLNYLKNESNLTRTENGAVTYAGTMSHCMDLFATIGALRHAEDKEIITRFSRAFAEDADLAMKILFFGRDVRGGLGERRVFRTIVKWLADHEPASLRKNIALIPEYGRFDDLLTLMDTACEQDALAIIRRLLQADLAAEENVSLLAKWLPSVNTSKAETIRLGKKIARAGWNGKNQYVELAYGISYMNNQGEVVNVDHEAIGNKALAFVGTSGVQMGWLASQADMLADDWKIVE